MTHSSRWSQPQLTTVLGDLDAPRRQVLHELARIADEELAEAQVLTWNGEDAVDSGPFGLHRMILSTFAGLTASDQPYEPPPSWSGADEWTDAWTDVWQHFLEAAAQDGPIVLIVDDLHLADTTAEELVGLLAQLPGRVALTVIVGATPELLCNLDWSPGKRFATVVMLDEPTDSAAETTRRGSLALVRDSA